MAWARIDDAILDHPKVIEAGEDARDLLIASIIWCNKHLTDGRVPKGALAVLSRKKTASKTAAALVRVGLWDDRGDAWLLHDYLDWNPSRADVEAQREASKERMRKSREKRERGERATSTEDAPMLQRNERATSASVAAPTPLHSDPEETDPPPTPSAGAAGADGPASEPAAAAPAAPPDPKPPKRAKRTRPPSPDVEAVRSAVLELVGVEYPEAAWDQLRARLREGATRDDALEFVRWASAQPWEGGQVRLDPTVLFRRERFATGLAKARASPAGRMRLVGGLAPPPREPEREAPRVGAVEVRRCAWCPQVMPHRWDGHGWIVAYHEGCGSPHATSMRARDVFDEIAATEAFAAAEAAQ